MWCCLKPKETAAHFQNRKAKALLLKPKSPVTHSPPTGVEIKIPAQVVKMWGKKRVGEEERW
jgi:hypothetical protein